MHGRTTLSMCFSALYGLSSLVLGGCAERIGPDPRPSLYGPDLGEQVNELVGPKPAAGTALLTLNNLGELARSCRESELGLGAAPATAKCEDIYQALYQQAVHVSNLACTDYINRVYDAQFQLRSTQTIGNYAAGAAGAVVGIAQLGSAIGAALSMGTALFNEGLDTANETFLFGVKASTVRSMIAERQEALKQGAEKLDLKSFDVVREVVQNYFMICHPMNIEAYIDAKLTDRPTDRGRADALESIAGAIVAGLQTEAGYLIDTGKALKVPEVYAAYAFINQPAELERYKGVYVAVLKTGRLLNDDLSWNWNEAELGKEVAQELKRKPKAALTSANQDARANLERQLIRVINRLAATASKPELDKKSAELFAAIESATVATPVQTSPKQVPAPVVDQPSEINPDTPVTTQGLEIAPIDVVPPEVPLSDPSVYNPSRLTYPIQ